MDAMIEHDSRPPGRLVYFAGIFIPVLLLCLTALASLTYSHYSRLADAARGEQIGLVNRLATSVENIFGVLNRQAAALTREGYLRDYLNDQVESPAALAERYRTIAANAPVAFQIQLIDRNGDEVTRIVSDGSGTRIEPYQALQNRRDEEYFSKALELPENSRYASPVFLFSHEGVPSDPSQPLIIYSMPVSADNGNRWGVLTLWMRASVIFEAIRTFENPTSSHIWVADREGNWLIGPGASEWPGASGRLLADQDPALWRRISSSGALSFQHEGSFYSRIPICNDESCRTAFDPAAAGGIGVPLDLPESAWYLIAHLPASELALSQLLLDDYLGWLPLALVLVAITMLSAWIAWRHASAAMALRMHETRLGQLNDELQAEKDNLEERVSERTTQLAQATAAAQSANKAKSAFLATMSHEIRTPMYGIIGSIDVLRRSSLGPRQLEQTSLIRDSADSLLAIIEDILDFSKIEADKITLECEPVLLGYVIDSACIAMTPIADKNRVRLNVYRASSLPRTVKSDAVRLRQIITNLVSNAIKFSANENGGGRVWVNFDWAAAGELCIRVEDNGIGMDAAALAVIFESFSQADVSTTRRFGGTGLGLTITRRLVELMQGKIDVESQPGVGSTFTVTLPLSAEADALSEQLPDLHDVTVYLIADDVTETRAWLDWLRRYGASVHQSQRDTLVEEIPAAGQPGRTVVLLSDTAASESADARLMSELRPRIGQLIIIKNLSGSRVKIVDGIVYLNRHPSHNRMLEKVLAVINGQADALEEAPEQPTEAVTLNREQARAAGRLILVAEDNEVNQDVIRNQLEALGYACDVARHGLDALELWNRNRGQYALLLTDIHMPVMDGYELTAAIRCEEVGAHFPILAFTANATRGERANCLDCGMNDYLTKPLPLHTLKLKLQQWAIQASGKPENGLPVFDSTVLPASVGNDQGRVDQLLKKFRAAARTTAEQVRAAQKANDMERIAAIAHKLKSSSRAVGALALGDICRKLEEDANNRNRPLVGESVSAFLLVLEKTLEILAAAAEGQERDDRTTSDIDDR